MAKASGLIDAPTATDRIFTAAWWSECSLAGWMFGSGDESTNDNRSDSENTSENYEDESEFGFASDMANHAMDGVDESGTAGVDEKIVYDQSDYSGFFDAPTRPSYAEMM